jgi:hypothetical protein
MKNRKSSLPNGLGNFNESPTSDKKVQVPPFLISLAIAEADFPLPHRRHKPRETLNETPHFHQNSLFF